MQRWRARRLGEGSALWCACGYRRTSVCAIFQLQSLQHNRICSYAHARRNAWRAGAGVCGRKRWMPPARWPIAALINFPRVPSFA